MARMVVSFRNPVLSEVTFRLRNVAESKDELLDDEKRISDRLRQMSYDFARSVQTRAARQPGAGV